MHDHQVLIFVALMVFLFGLVSKVSAKWYISGPMEFVIVGVVVSPLGLGVFTLHTDADTVKLLAEVTLMLILFVDATLIDVDVLRKMPSRIPARLLGIGLPLTVVLGFITGWLIFDDMGLWAVALIASCLHQPTQLSARRWLKVNRYQIKFVSR